MNVNQRCFQHYKHSLFFLINHQGHENFVFPLYSRNLLHYERGNTTLRLLSFMYNEWAFGFMALLKE